MIKPQQLRKSQRAFLSPARSARPGKACGFAADDREYNRLLREAALGLGDGAFWMQHR